MAPRSRPYHHRTCPLTPSRHKKEVQSSNVYLHIYSCGIRLYEMLTLWVNKFSSSNFRISFSQTDMGVTHYYTFFTTPGVEQFRCKTLWPTLNYLNRFEWVSKLDNDCILTELKSVKKATIVDTVFIINETHYLGLTFNQPKYCFRIFTYTVAEIR